MPRGVKRGNENQITNKDRCLLAIFDAGRPIRAKEIAKELSLLVDKIYVPMYQLKKENLIIHKGYQQYEITDEGRNYLVDKKVLEKYANGQGEVVIERELTPAKVEEPVKVEPIIEQPIETPIPLIVSKEDDIWRTKYFELLDKYEILALRAVELAITK